MQEQEIARQQRQFPLLIAAIGERTHQHPRRHFDRLAPSLTQQQRRPMAAVGQHQPAASHLQQAAEQGGEHAAVVTVLQGIVQALQHQARRALTAGQHPHQPHDPGHQQGGGDAMARHVADAQEKMLFIDEEGIEEVAPHVGGRFHVRRHGDVGALGEHRIIDGQHRGLQGAGQLQLLVQLGQFQPVAFRRHRQLIREPHPFGQRAHQVAGHARQGHDPGPEHRRRQLQHRCVRLGPHQGRGRESVDGGELADALPYRQGDAFDALRFSRLGIEVHPYRSLQDHEDRAVRLSGPEQGTAPGEPVDRGAPQGTGQRPLGHVAEQGDPAQGCRIDTTG